MKTKINEFIKMKGKNFSTNNTGKRKNRLLRNAIFFDRVVIRKRKYNW